jgi:glycosyltransferase involved in cell wall biosynthesis
MMLIELPPDAGPAAAPTLSAANWRAKKILLVAHKFPPFMGGIEMHTYEVGRRMAAWGHAVTVLTGDPTGKLAKEENVEGMRVLRVPVYPKSSDVFFAPSLYGAVAAADCDVIHIQGFHTLVPPVAMTAGARTGKPYVLTFHSGGHSSRARNLVRGLQRAVLRPLLARADRLIAVSEFEASHFAAGLRMPRERFVVVPNGAEIEAGPSVGTVDQTKPLIITVGRLEKYKGHHRAIAAFAKLLEIYPTAELRVLGEGPFRPNLVQLVQELGLGERVTIGGIPPGERGRMGAMMSRAALVAFLSDYEAHPVAALEAISLGRPVIASDSTGFQEMVAKGLVRGVDPHAPPSVIARAMADEIARPAKATTRVALNSWDDCARNLVEIYHNVAGRGDAPAGGVGRRLVNRVPLSDQQSDNARASAC